MATSRATTTRVQTGLRTLRERMGLSRERMARLLDTSSKSIERWEAQGTGPTTRGGRKQLEKIAEIVELGLIVYTPEGFRIFLGASLAELSGLTPLQAIEIGQADRVYGALAGDYEGLGF